MEIDGLFQSPAKRLAEFARIQTLLYREDPALQDYFMQLQMGVRSEAVTQYKSSGKFKHMVVAAIRNAERAIKPLPRKEIKADVLYCPIPYFARKTENQFLIQTLLGLAQTEATIICLMSDDAPCRTEIESKLQMMGRSGQVQFIDPMGLANSIEARIRKLSVQLRANREFEKATEILALYGVTFTPHLRDGFKHIAGFVEAWERLAPLISFESVVARCHWHALCSPVCRTALQRGKPVVTFQQGVIGHTLDVPVTASQYVAFGQSSSSFLAKLNHRFFADFPAQETTVNFVNGGCLYDKITQLPDQFELKTVLLVDVPMAQGDFYGIESQCSALIELAQKLLSSLSQIRRVILRPHPYWSDLDFEACQCLVRSHPQRCELSHPVWSLEDDISRSSIVIGVFSGVLTVAAACGLPTIFLHTKDGYMTGDLECFSPEQTLLSDEAFDEAKKCLTDKEHYRRVRGIALKNGGEYYTNGKNLDLTGEFFECVLGSKPVVDKTMSTFR